MRGRSVVRALFFAMLGTGLAMGALFPIVVTPFAQYLPGRKAGFVALCLGAGLVVGALNFLLVRIFLLRTVEQVGGQLEALSRGEGLVASRLSLDSDDALGRLVTRFNHLIDRLQKSLQEVLPTVEALVAHAGETGTAAGVLLENVERKSQVVAGTATLFEGLRRDLGTMRGLIDRLQAAAQESGSAVQLQVGQVEAINTQVDQLQRRNQLNAEGIGRAAGALQRIGGSTEQLTQTLDQAAASMTEMDFSVREIERGIGGTAEIAERTAADAGQGDEAVRQTQEAMERIRDGVGAAAGGIRLFTQKVVEIAAIADVIDEVTEQTNLLALNAAIIAAQAGSHGAGFAVVAGQIKKLAERTAASTREIGGLAEGFREQAGAALAAMTESQSLVENGVLLSRRAGEALGRIREGADISHKQIASVDRALREVSGTSHLLSKSVEEVAGGAREIASATREQEAELAALGNSVEESRAAAVAIAVAVRTQLAAAREIRRQVEISGTAFTEGRGVVGAIGEQADLLATTIETMQDIDQRDRGHVVRWARDAERLVRQGDAVRSEIERLKPGGRDDGRRAPA